MSMVHIDFSSRISALRGVGTALGVPSNLLPSRNASISEIECLRWINLQRVAMSLPRLPGLDYNGFVGAINDLAKLAGNGSGDMGRQLLTGDMTYHVETTGDDTSGDGSVAKPWATLQKALDYCAMIDFAANTVTINMGAGNFLGAATHYMVGGGILTVNGAGSAQTIITGGAQDSPSSGACFKVNGNMCGTAVTINKVTLVPVNASYGIAVDCTGGVFSMMATMLGEDTDIVIDTRNGAYILLSFFNPCQVVYGGGETLVVNQGGKSIVYGVFCQYGASVQDNGGWQFNGTPDTYTAFVRVRDDAAYINPNYGDITGNIPHGKKFRCTYNSYMNVSGGTGFLPGDVAGTWSATSAYNEVMGAGTGTTKAEAEQDRMDLEVAKRIRYG